MPEFYADAISVSTDGPNGDFIVKVGKKQLVLSFKEAKQLSEQIGYAVEFVELYARGPR